MKKLFLISLLFLTFNFVIRSAWAQTENLVKLNPREFVGIWQANTSVISSGLQAYFQFYENGIFIYNKSSYDELNPLLNIYGHYKIEQNLLWFKVDSSKQLINAKIVGENSGFQFNLFVLIGGKVTTVAQNGNDYDFHMISSCSKGITGKRIIIDNNKYYKLSSNPDKYSTNDKH